MNLWSELARVALMGTEGDPLSLPKTDPLLGDLSARLGSGVAAGRPPEQVLLGMAAALSLARSAGWQPSRTSDPLPPPAPPETQPTCGAALSHLLRRLLDGEAPGVLDEWLALVAQAGYRVPEERLAPLLGKIGWKPERDPNAWAVLGSRGRWLVAQQPDAAVVSESTAPVEIWETGSRDERLALFRAERERDPEAARRMVEATWLTEPPTERAALMPLMKIGLNLADEPFLEAALDDRRREVRHAAADLLARLPGSRLLARTLARLESCLAFQSSGRGALTVQPPTACDPAMVRDGIEPKPPTGSPLGERAWWLQQLIALVPPSHWSARWTVTPSDLLRLAKATDWADALRDGWAAATDRHRDGDWAEALVTASLVPMNVAPGAGPSGPGGAFLALNQTRRSSTDGGIFTALRPEQRERLALAALARSDLYVARALLDAHRVPWSDGLARQVIQQTRAQIWPLSTDTLVAYARFIDPALTDEVTEMCNTPSEGAHGDPVIERFIAVLTFRRDLHAALAAASNPDG